MSWLLKTAILTKFDPHNQILCFPLPTARRRPQGDQTKAVPTCSCENAIRQRVVVLKNKTFNIVYEKADPCKSSIWFSYIKVCYFDTLLCKRGKICKKSKLCSESIESYESCVSNTSDLLRKKLRTSSKIETPKFDQQKKQEIWAWTLIFR